MKMVHVTIQTKKFEEEIKFYQEIVGLNIQREINGTGRRIVFLSDGSGDPQIEIIDSNDAENSGNQHLSLGFKANDLTELRDKLINKGYKVSEMISPMPQIQFFFVNDPAGVTIQFM